MNPIPLFGRGFSSKSPTVTAQLLTNLYREPQGDPDKTAMALYGTHGLTLFADLGASPARGAWSVGSFIYAVHGNTLYSINNAGVYTALGVLNTNSGRVSMIDNGVQLMIVDGTNGYILTLATSVFAQIVSANFPNGARTVTFLNGYFIVDNQTNKGRFNWSASYDGTTWAALDFATAESNPDGLNAVKANAGDLFLFGETTTEIWGPSGDTAIFRRTGGAGLEWGLPSPWALDKFDNTSLIFLGKNKLGQAQLVRLEGFNATPLTDPDVTHDINIRNPLGATGYAYSLDTHTFYQLNFSDRSYLYDEMSNSFSLVSSGGTGFRHYGEVRVELFGVPYVADYRNGRWYKVDPNAYTDNGDAIVRELISRHIFNNYDRVSIAALFIDFETGVGLQTGQGSNPQAMLSWSKDNGRTYGNEIWTTIGAVGAYGSRAVWRILGRAYDFVMKLRISDPIKVVIAGAGVEVS